MWCWNVRQVSYSERQKTHFSFWIWGSTLFFGTLAQEFLLMILIPLQLEHTPLLEHLFNCISDLTPSDRQGSPSSPGSASIMEGVTVGLRRSSVYSFHLLAIAKVEVSSIPSPLNIVSLPCSWVVQGFSRIALYNKGMSRPYFLQKYGHETMVLHHGQPIIHTPLRQQS